MYNFPTPEISLLALKAQVQEMDIVEQDRDQLVEKIKIIENQRDDLLRKGKVVESERNNFLRNNKLMEMQKEDLDSRCNMLQKTNVTLNSRVSTGQNSWSELLFLTGSTCKLTVPKEVNPNLGSGWAGESYCNCSLSGHGKCS